MQPSSGSQITWNRVLGTTLIGAGVLGLLISLAGLIFVTVASTTARAALARELNTLDRSLTAASEGLAIADSTLAEARTTLSSVSTTLINATQAITATQPTIASLQELTGTGLPQTINSTRQALASAQETARIVDGVLSTIAIFGVSYNPEVPLNVTIGEVSDSLAALPPTFEEVSTGLSTASTNLDTIAGDLARIAESLDTIAESMGEATAVIDQYQTIVADLQAEVAAVRGAAPGWITAVSLGLMLLLIWLALAQVGLLWQGRELIRRDVTGRREAMAQKGPD